MGGKRCTKTRLEEQAQTEKNEDPQQRPYLTYWRRSVTAAYQTTHLVDLYLILRQILRMFSTTYIQEKDRNKLEEKLGRD